MKHTAFAFQSQQEGTLPVLSRSYREGSLEVIYLQLRSSVCYIMLSSEDTRSVRAQASLLFMSILVKLHCDLGRHSVKDPEKRLRN